MILSTKLITSTDYHQEVMSSNPRALNYTDIYIDCTNWKDRKDETFTSKQYYFFAFHKLKIMSRENFDILIYFCDFVHFVGNCASCFAHVFKG